ncbi:MAG: hypothetical protein HQK54_08015 [Oligoflexales bacterium]|nr:hypothetical protein [Oligoflexales bacterium]
MNEQSYKKAIEYFEEVQKADRGDVAAHGTDEIRKDFGMSEREKITITGKEHHALSFIYGLNTNAHLMVIMADRTETGNYILEGSSEAFDELTSDLAEEIEYRLSPPSRLRHLEKLYQRLTPDVDDF